MIFAEKEAMKEIEEENPGIDHPVQSPGGREDNWLSALKYAQVWPILAALGWQQVYMGGCGGSVACYFS